MWKVLLVFFGFLQVSTDSYRCSPSCAKRVTTRRHPWVEFCIIGDGRSSKFARFGQLRPWLQSIHFGVFLDTETSGAPNIASWLDSYLFCIRMSVCLVTFVPVDWVQLGWLICTPCWPHIWPVIDDWDLVFLLHVICLVLLRMERSYHGDLHVLSVQPLRWSQALVCIQECASDCFPFVLNVQWTILCKQLPQVARCDP